MRYWFLILSLCGLAAPLSAQAAPGDERVRAELVPEFLQALPGQPAWLAISLTPEPGWHVYWENPGDAGLATAQRWRLPPGASVEERLWPLPKAYREGELMTYGYGDRHLLLTAVRMPSQPAGTEVPLQVALKWLVCKDICIPGGATLDTVLTLADKRGAPTAPGLFAAARLAIPAPADGWPGAWAPDGDGVAVHFGVPAELLEDATVLEFFPRSTALVDYAAPVRWQRAAEGVIWRASRSPLFVDWPAQIDGLLVIEGPRGRRGFDVRLPRGDLPAARGDFGGAGRAPSATAIALPMALLFAFLGGLILNLMPCVFPVLALKALSLAGAEHDGHRRSESLVYALGVVLSFLVVAGLLLGLRAGGAALGWGFQLQNPVFVGLMGYLMLVVAMGLAGWTELGVSLMGLGQDQATRNGHPGAFFTGVLAVVVASPCTAPFMGAALGYAVTQPPAVALGVFASLGVGMALPFVLLAWVPALARRLPRPGPWMLRVKQIMAVPMLITAGWLFWVMSRQTDAVSLALVLGGALLLAAALRQGPRGRLLPPRVAAAAAVLALAAFAWPGFHAPPAQARAEAGWLHYSPARVEALQAQGRPVLVNFTADWCISCLVNERTAFASDEVQRLLAAHDFTLFKADWTNYDPEITAALARFGRNGVPLYLVYPVGGGEPQILPQLLTASILVEAVSAAAD